MANGAAFSFTEPTLWLGSYRPNVFLFSLWLLASRQVGTQTLCIIYGEGEWQRNLCLRSLEASFSSSHLNCAEVGVSYCRDTTQWRTLVQHGEGWHLMIREPHWESLGTWLGLCTWTVPFCWSLLSHLLSWMTRHWGKVETFLTDSSGGVWGWTFL